MKATIDVKEPPGAGGFVVSQPIRGVVTVQISSPTSISAMQLSLEGTIATRLRDADSLFVKGDDNGLNDFHQIFEYSSLLYPPTDRSASSKPGTLNKGVHRFPFEITLPRACHCRLAGEDIGHFETALPPSFECTSFEHGASARVKYVLRLDIARAGRLQRHISVEKKIRIICNDLATSPDTQNESVASALLGLDDPGSKSPRQHRVPDSWDGKSPVLVVQSRLKPCAVLHVGEEVPLTLQVRTLPESSAEERRMRLQSVHARLRSDMNVSAKARRRAWALHQDVIKIGDFLAPQFSSGQWSISVEPETLGPASLPKDLTPSFNTCSVGVTYTLEVSVGVLVGDETKPIVAKLRMPIKVSAGPKPHSAVLPAYTAVAQNTTATNLFSRGSSTSSVDSEITRCPSYDHAGYSLSLDSQRGTTGVRTAST